MAPDFDDDGGEVYLGEQEDGGGGLADEGPAFPPLEERQVPHHRRVRGGNAEPDSEDEENNSDSEGSQGSESDSDEDGEEGNGGDRPPAADEQPQPEPLHPMSSIQKLLTVASSAAMSRPEQERYRVLADRMEREVRSFEQRISL